MKQVLDFMKKYSVIAVLILLIIIFGGLKPASFLTAGNLFTVLRQVSITGIMTVGLMFVMLAGGIDLSIGSVVSFVGILASYMMVKCGIPPVAAIIITLLISTVIGLLMGMIIVKTGIFPMIGTLAVSQILQGTAYIICGGLPISGLPKGVSKLSLGYVGIIPVPVILLFVIVCIAGFVLNYTYVGRYFYLVGSNGEAARLSGISRQGVQILSYGICACLSGFAGIIMLARINSGQAAVGVGMEMDCLTAAVIGGVSLVGGEGKITKAMAGILIMGVLANGMTILNFGEYQQTVIKGIIFLLAVCFDGIQKIMGEHVGKKESV